MLDAAMGAAADPDTGRSNSDPDGGQITAIIALFRMVFDYSFTATILVGDNHVIMRANPAAHRLLHCVTGELVGRSLDEFCPLDWADRAEQHNVGWPADEPHHGGRDVRLVTADGRSGTAQMHTAIVPPQTDGLRYLVQLSRASAGDTGDDPRRTDELSVDADGNDPTDGENRTVLVARTPLTAEQRDLLDQLAIIESQERTRMAEVIHDEPIQLIVAAMMRIENLRQRLELTDADELDQSANLLEGAVDRLRDLIVVALTPPDLSDGLGVALRDLAAGILVTTTTDFTVIGREHAHLAPSTQTAVYNILRDVLVGIRNAARAQHITLEITDRHGDLTFALTDDSIASILDPRGIGCDLVSLRARAAAVGGDLSLRNNPPRGGTLVVSLAEASAS